MSYFIRRLHRLRRGIKDKHQVTSGLSQTWVVGQFDKSEVGAHYRTERGSAGC